MAKDSKTPKKPVSKKTTTKKPVVTKKTTVAAKEIKPIINLEVLESDTVISPNTKDLASDVTIVDRPASNLLKPENISKLVAAIVAAIAIAGTLFVTSVYIPKYVLSETDEAKALRQKQEAESKSSQKLAEAKSKIADENTKLSFINQSVNMKLKDFGDLRISLKDQAAPKTVENFVRLAYRGYYNNNLFHRIVKAQDFTVIQGGDPRGDGSGGETADGNKLVDEVWKVKPEFDLDAATGQKGKTKNTPVFADPSLYADYQTDTGQVTYRKGLILMAKTAEVDSATSQFFITLDKTILPAEYTVFGVIDDSSFATLDKIKNEVEPVVELNQEGAAPQSKDGKPDKELRITTVEIIK